MSLEILRATERSAPLDLRPDHAKREISSWLNDRRSELSAWEKAKAESALNELEKLIGSIRTRLDAKAGEPPLEPVSHALETGYYIRLLVTDGDFPPLPPFGVFDV